MVLVVMLAMILGSIILRRPIAGSCGGLVALGMKKDCAICGDSSPSLSNNSVVQETLFYDADKQASCPKDE